MSTIAVFLAFAAVAAAVPSPCCVPQQWTGQRGGVGAELKGIIPELDAIGEFTAYDYVEKRLNLKREVRSLGGYDDRNETELFLFNKGMRYYVRDGVCNATKLEGSMPAFCVPGNAEFRGTATFGGSLDADSWGWRNGLNAVELIVTAEGCIPIIQATANVAFVEERAFAETWVNIKTGVSDNDFVVPSSCSGVEPVGTFKFDLMEYIVKDQSRKQLKAIRK